MKHQGTLDELRTAVASFAKGEWTDVAHGHQFKATNGAILIWFPSTGTLQFQGAQATKEPLRNSLETALSAEAVAIAAASAPGAASTQRQRVFVVHGHDSTAREQLELILHKLGLQPFVLANTSGGGLTIIEALEEELGPGEGRSRFGIVLMTPDDMGYALADGADRATARARQNVVLEMGMLIAALGRGNVAILKKGHLEVPSDASGILYLPFNYHVKETVPKLADRLHKAGFAIEPAQITSAMA